MKQTSIEKMRLTTETTANSKPKLAEVALHNVEIMERFYDCETDDFGNKKPNKSLGKLHIVTGKLTPVFSFGIGNEYLTSFSPTCTTFTTPFLSVSCLNTGFLKVFLIVGLLTTILFFFSKSFL